jgi:hypothetical protein
MQASSGPIRDVSRSFAGQMRDEMGFGEARRTCITWTLPMGETHVCTLLRVETASHTVRFCW